MMVAFKVKQRAEPWEWSGDLKMALGRLESSVCAQAETDCSLLPSALFL